jgi:hypothetical protein
MNFSLLNTLLVPLLSVNLISQSKLDIKFYFSTENGYQVRSRETHELFLEASVIGGLYIVNQVREFNTALRQGESHYMIRVFRAYKREMSTRHARWKGNWS